MYSIKQDMDIRFSEANDLIGLIKGIESGAIESSSIRLNAPVLRATVVLSLYNVIESITTQILKAIHNEIISKRVTYNNLTKELRDLALVYFYKHKEKRADIHSSLDVLHSTVDLVRGKSFFNIQYDAMSESYQLYSGNLDSRAIRKVMKKYGVAISEEIGTKLRPIMKGRNKLAHGELSFEDYGRTMVTHVLDQYYNDTNAFLNELILKSSEYLDTQSYKVTRKEKNQRNKKRR